MRSTEERLHDKKQQKTMYSQKKHDKICPHYVIYLFLYAIRYRMLY